MWVRAWCAAGRELFLLLLRRRAGHQLLVIEAVPFAFGFHRQNVRDVTEANKFTLVGHLLAHLDVDTLVEGTLSPQVVKVDIVNVVADEIVALALLVQLFLDSC